MRIPIIAAALLGLLPVMATAQEHMAADETAVYTLVDEVDRNRSVSDATYANAVAAVGEQGVVDALGLVGYYSMLAMVMNTARTPLPAGATPGLVALPR